MDDKAFFKVEKIFGSLQSFRFFFEKIFGSLKSFQFFVELYNLDCPFELCESFQKERISIRSVFQLLKRLK